MKKIFFAVTVFLMFSGCSDFKDSLIGTVGEKCFGNGTCKDGLICIEGKCAKDEEAENDDDSGNTGDTGDTGDTGNTGNTGDTGNSGDTGDSGNTGNTGDDDDVSNVETEVDEDVINDPCDPNPCSTVENSDNSCMPEDDEEYVCGCKPGFLWNDAEKKCDAIPDPCLEDPCAALENSFCVPEKTEDQQNFTGDHECRCNEGFDKGFIGTTECIPAFKSVSAGKDHACAIDYYDKLYCWGSNFNAQLGNSLTGTGDGNLEKIPFKVN
ncbi:MAG TPA: RCC1 domain-containing protein, partial [bacterium]|nr:RCC1 domain-containing protein [bacterium]